MLHHVSVGVRDVARAATFYDPVMKALGYKRVADYSPGAIAYGEAKGKPEFWIGLPLLLGALAAHPLRGVLRRRDRRGIGAHRQDLADRDAAGDLQRRLRDLWL